MSATATLEAPAEQPANEQPQARAFVILNDGVGDKKKGQCVGEFSFQVGTEFDRLCFSGAIRPAMAHEVPGTVVDLKNTLKPGVSLTQQLNQANEMIVRLNSEITLLKQENEKLQTAKSAIYDPEKDERTLAYRTRLEGALKTSEGIIRSKDEEIEGLRKRLNAPEARKGK